MGELNDSGVVENSDFSALGRCILRAVRVKAKIVIW